MKQGVFHLGESAERSRAPSDGPVDVAQGSALFFASSVMSAAGFFVAALMLARGLGPAGRGSVAFVTVAALVLARVAKLGIGEATSVLAAQRPADRAVLLSNLLAFSLLAGVVSGGVLAGALFLLDAEPAGVTRSQLAILAAAIVAASLVDENFLIGCGRLREAAAISAGGGWLYAASLAIAFLTVGPSVDSALVAWVAAHLAWAGVLAGVGWRAAGRSRPGRHLLAEAMRFGARAWAGGTALLLNARADQILLGLIASDAALGFYAVAVNGAEVLLFLPTAVATSLLPAVARQRDLSSPARTLRTFRSATLLTLASIAGAAAVGWLAIPFVFGREYEDSVAPFMWLLPGALGYTALSIFSRSLLASHAPGMSSLGSAVALGVGLPLDLALIPAFGASGAAAAASAAFIAGGATVAVLYRRVTGFAARDLVPTVADLVLVRAATARALRGARGSA